jgi:hypothetical protein
MQDVTPVLRRLVPEPASRLQAALVVVATAGLCTFLIVHNAQRPELIEGTPPVAATKPAVFPIAVSPAELTALASSISQPIYWVGPRPGVTYELTRATRTNVSIRYLPAGVPVGDNKPALTVHTYPLKNAFAATRAIENEPHAVFHRLALGGRAVYRPSKPKYIYVAYPDSDFQIEIFAPDPAEARVLATSPELQPVLNRP